MKWITLIALAIAMATALGAMHAAQAHEPGEHGEHEGEHTHDDAAGDHAHEHPHTSARTRASQDRDRTTLRVMSFNIRYGTANDGDNNWRHRRELVAHTIDQFDPDLLGTQEVQHFQAEYLKENLRGYRFHGVGRDDGKERGEYAAIFYRAGRFRKLDAGHFWLSERPDTPGSVSWDSSMTRMASWLLLKDQRTHQTLAVLNTHWDHRGPQARLESAKLIRRRIEQWPADTAIIVMGDFNTTEKDAPHQTLLQPTDDKTHALIDAYRAVHHEVTPDEATYHGFNGKTKGMRIDWILCSEQFEVLDAAIDRTHTVGITPVRYPSDHYPVTATLELRE